VGTDQLTNGGMETWAGGDNVAPTGWTNSYTTAKESTIVKVGTYSAHISMDGVNNSNMTQDIQNAGGHNIAYWQGKRVTFGCWVNSTNGAVGGNGSIYIYDGVSVTNGPFVTTDGNWHWLTVTKVISGSATQVLLGCLDKNGYFDGAIAVEGNTIAEDGALNYLQSYSSTTHTQGTYALKAEAAITDSLNKTLTHTVSSTNLSGVSKMVYDIRASRTGSNIKLGWHDTGGTTTEHAPNILTAGSFQREEVNFKGVLDANKDAIAQLIITMTNADEANTFYIDNIRYK
jgi:hypothetical protein